VGHKYAVNYSRFKTYKFYCLIQKNSGVSQD
jgi:hypothetical protein